MISFRPRERAPRIGLVGWFGSGNIGNDGTLEALLGHLRTAYPQAAVDVLTNAPDVVTERYGRPRPSSTGCTPRIRRERPNDPWLAGRSGSRTAP